MKVLWISDFSIKHNKGGAQRSDDIIIRKGLELGHDITHFTHDSDLNLLTEPYDNIISANLEHISRLFPAVVGWLSSQNNHSRLEHDKNAYLNPNERRLLFGNCKNTFFLSEYHYSVFKRSYGDFFVNVKIIQDPIDTSLFYNRKNPREDKILGIGFMHYLKGTETLFDCVFKNPDKKFVIAGWGSKMYEHLAKSSPNVEFLGLVDYEKMPDLLNRYQTLFYHPIVEEPFCRSVAEAILCGVNVSINENIGCAHELNRVGLDKFSQNCNSAQNQFWDTLVL